MLDVCICTHNPQLDILSLVMQSLAKQTVDRGTFRVLVIDNASVPRIGEAIFAQLRNVGIETRLAFEPVPGLQRARLHAIGKTSCDWILWVDDDNELSPNYIEQGLNFIQLHPEVGCFGGKLVLPDSISPKSWVLPFLPFLGIKDAGENIIIQKADKWGPWEPPGAGSWVHRKVLDEYCRRARVGEEFFRLGRVGSSGLASGDDSVLMRGAYHVDMACAYVPQLQLLHHLNRKRFAIKYLVRLMKAYGASHVVLESILRGPQSVPNYYANIGVFFMMLLWRFIVSSKHSVAFAIGQVAYHLGARHEYLKEGTAVQDRGRDA